MARQNSVDLDNITKKDKDGNETLDWNVINTIVKRCNVGQKRQLQELLSLDPHHPKLSQSFLKYIGSEKEGVIVRGVLKSIIEARGLKVCMDKDGEKVQIVQHAKVELEARILQMEARIHELETKLKSKLQIIPPNRKSFPITVTQSAKKKPTKKKGANANTKSMRPIQRGSAAGMAASNNNNKRRA
eukprot:857067_1